MKCTSLFLALLLGFSPVLQALDSPRLWSISMAETLMKRAATNPHDSDGLTPWSYWKGFTLDGFEMLWRATGDQRYFNFIRQEIDPYIDDNGNLVHVNLDSLDNVMAANIVVGLYEQTHDQRYRSASMEIRKAFDRFPRNPDGGFWHSPRLPGEMWSDGVFMGQMFLLRYGKSIGDRKYCFDEAAKQIILYSKHARKGQSGLYYHAWTAKPALAKVLPDRKVLWADPETGLSSEVWSEGLGWYALVLTEALADLPPDHPQRAQVLEIYERLAVDLKKLQDPATGGWFQVVDKGDQAGNFIDPSGSAMFTYAIQRGIDLGILSGAEYRPVVIRGYAAVVSHAVINAKGLLDLEGTCNGICVQASYRDYVNYPQTINAKESVAAFLWATTIVERDQLRNIQRTKH